MATATPLTNIENGIITGDWNLVCEGFNKLTGKKLKPIVITPQVEEFNPETASKRELYKWIKDKYDIAPMKTFTVDELKEMAVIFSANQVHSINNDYTDELTAEIKVQELSDGAAFLDGFRYHSGRNKLLPIDKLKVNAVLEPALKGDDGPDREITKREAPKKINMKCLKCNKSFMNYSYLAVETGGELKSLCPNCSESL